MSASKSLTHPGPRASAEPLRVLMICYEYPPLGGGTAAACSYLLSEMSRNDDIQIDLVTSGTSSRIELVDLAPHIRIHRLPIAKRDLHYWRPGELTEWTWRALPYARQLSLIEQARLFGRLVRALRGFLRDPIDAQAAHARVRADLHRRGENLFRIISQGVLAVPGSPYRALLEHAGATAEEATDLIRREGVEGALERLYDAGV